jgi:hypothetical protein
MNNPSHNDSSTALSDARFEECFKDALIYLETKPSIRNRDIRRISGIGYDQAIRFFNRAISEGRLIRQGSGSGTCYAPPPRQGKSNGRK